MNDISYLEGENEKLTQDRDKLDQLLREANEVIDGIKNGNVDAVFVANNEAAKTLVTKIADHTYKTFIDNMSEGVITIHADGIILYTNPSFAKTVNLPLEKIVGTNFRKFIPEEHIDRFETFFKDHPDSTEKVSFSMLDEQGGRLHFIVSLNKLEMHGFQVLNLVMTDVTFQKKVEEKLVIVNENLKIAIDKRRSSEEHVVLLNKKLKDNIRTLEHANAELATFAYIASHDLQEPLRKIFTYTSLFTRDYYDSFDDQGKHYVRTIQSSSERMRKLINDILEYAGLSHDMLFKPVKLDSIINEVLSDLEIIINETNATIIIEEKLPEIDANATQVKQLFQNLLTNALKFIKAAVKPVITINYKIVSGNQIEKMVESRHNELFCVLYFKDNGIGFNPVYTNKIFTIFQRLNNSSVYKGTGIGLAICKKVVDQHNGFIIAESKPDEGALFTVMLPVIQNHETNVDA